MEAAYTRLEEKLAAREQEQVQVITNLTLQNAPKLSEIDPTWAEQLAPVHAPDKCRMPKG